MEIAAIIPCLNEEKYVGKLLDDICGQTVIPKQVIVADCMSTDRTVDTAEGFKSRLPLSVVQSPIKSAAAARNCGAERANADYLLFLDADMRIPNDFIEQLQLKYQSTKAEFISPSFVAENRHPIDNMIAAYLNFWIGIDHMKFRHDIVGIGGGMLVRKSLHDEIGGYNSQIREFDDIDYSARINKAHPTYAFASKARATVSSRRFEQQGRIGSILQSFPDNNAFVRHVLRPIMRYMGVAPKWHDIQ